MLETKNLKIPNQSVRFGCDPEFFFEKKGKIIGSEKIIDIKEGFKISNNYDIDPARPKDLSKFIVDGVQAELNPKSSTCRQSLGSEIAKCFAMLYEKMKADPEISINFMPTVKITKKELDTLADSSKVFGCSPSKNTNTNSLNAVKLKDPLKYRYRSAGGHIHISAGYDKTPQDPVNAILTQPERLVQMLDIIVGNTCVLIDKDPSNKERRKTYGKAGEFRTPPYGVEYRTLSNFWLRSYTLMSLVMGLSRLAVCILAGSIPGRDFEKEILSLVNPKAIRKAINTNNFKLAKENWDKIQPLLMRITDNSNTPFTPDNIKYFEYFITKDLDHWFKEDPLQHWIKYPEGRTPGWETFALKNIKTEYDINQKEQNEPKN